VKASFVLNPPPLFVEIGPNLLQVVREGHGVELPLKRQPDGRLTQPCKEKTIEALKQFVGAKGWQLRARAFCAINSRGVSLRRLSLPGGTKERFTSDCCCKSKLNFHCHPMNWPGAACCLAKPSRQMARSPNRIYSWPP